MTIFVREIPLTDGSKDLTLENVKYT